MCVVVDRFLPAILRNVRKMETVSRPLAEELNGPQCRQKDA